MKRKLAESAAVLPVDAEQQTSESANLQPEVNNYPYEVDSNDHCESPLEAYRDIAPILEQFALESYKTKETLRIYDPYFCEGSVVERLNQLGFATVYNKKEDFYARIAANDLPEYDVLVTNPPYSEDHMERLMNFVYNSNKPWFLLIPNYVYCKPYYIKHLQGSKYCSSLTFYVTPEKRYLYTTPKGRRQAKSAKYTSPFPTFWYCNLFRYTDNVFAALNLKLLRIVRDIKNLPNSCICEHDPKAKRLKNAEKRKKNKDRKKAKA